jgi:hypothetical protein
MTRQLAGHFSEAARLQGSAADSSDLYNRTLIHNYARRALSFVTQHVDI